MVTIYDYITHEVALCVIGFGSHPRAEGMHPYFSTRCAIISQLVIFKVPESALRDCASFSSLCEKCPSFEEQACQSVDHMYAALKL